jgi:uncharacterized membrane protein YhaH (DUF805 family)
MNITQLLFSFNGRIRRTHYWLGALGMSAALGVVIMIIVLVFGGGAMMAAQGGDTAGQAAGAGLGIVGLLLYIAVLVFAVWVGLALQVKRWHDRDKGWPWIFISFIPLVGPFWALIECGFLDGTLGPNRFGPSPKGIVGPPPVQPVAPAAPPPVV